MRTRLILAVGILVACCVASVSGRSYTHYQTERNVGVFANEEETTFVGLRIVFDDVITPLQAIGIGATFTLSSNEDGVLVYEGTIIPFGMLEIDWALDGPRIVAAFWIDATGIEWPIDVHSPNARMRFTIPPGSDEAGAGCVPYVPIDIEFKGNWSKDPDGLPLERHQWSWSDGVRLDGEIVERTFWFPGLYTVILTVWDLEGLAHSIEESFRIYIYSCPEA
jgi:hypothetical protein